MEKKFSTYPIFEHTHTLGTSVSSIRQPFSISLLFTPVSCRLFSSLLKDTIQERLINSNEIRC